MTTFLKMLVTMETGQCQVLHHLKSRCFQNRMATVPKACQTVLVKLILERTPNPSYARWYNFEEPLKDSSSSTNYIFEINVGKKRIRHTTTLKLNFEINSKSIEDGVIEIQSRSISDPLFSDIDFLNERKWFWSEIQTLNTLKSV